MRTFFFLALLVSMFCYADSGEEKIIGDYSKPLTEAEKQNINYIITTLSEHSMFGLYKYQEKLEEAGAQIEHVHPLRHLGYVFSTPDLIAKTQRIQRYPWKRYARDFRKPLTLAVKQGKLDQSVLDDFAKRVNINVEILQPYVQQGDWINFVDTLRNQKK